LDQVPRRFIMDEWPCARNMERRIAPSDAAHLLDARAWLSDIAPRAVDAARANAEKLGVQEYCSLSVSDFETAVENVPDATAVVTNVPYGVRLSTTTQVNELLARLDALLLTRPLLRPAVVLWAGHGVPRGLRANWEHVVN